MVDLCIYNISNLYTMNPMFSSAENPLGKIENAAIAFQNHKIVFVGSTKDAPSADSTLDADQCIMMPGLVDCHTHAFYGGSRSTEFAARLAGASYAEILEAGGGIHSTVRATRNGSEAALLHAYKERLTQMIHKGVTTVEVKGGYGLSTESELRAHRLIKTHGLPISTVGTFLAHTIPVEWQNRRAAFVDNIINEQLPACREWIVAADVYCDRGAFTLDESIEILGAAQAMGLKIRAHAEQVTHTGIGAAASKMGATTVDHLERCTEEDVAIFAENGTVATLLPGAQLFLKDAPPPTALLREAGIPMAVATDLNPGSSPIHDLWTCATLSCLLQGLTIPEAILGITRHAGQALGYDNLGWLGDGSASDCILLRPPPGEPPIIESVIQHIGAKKIAMVAKNARIMSINTQLQKGWSDQSKPR